ncbi:MAG: hypothetical protein ACFFCM_09025 [Promethearchaeota archaeon]
MSNSSQKDILKQINELFHKVELEEYKYEWQSAIEILERAEKISLENEIKEIQGEIYYKFGEIYQIAADYQKIEKKVLNQFQLAIANFEKAHNVFKELIIDEKVNSALGSINLLKYISGLEIGEELLLESAKNHFHKAKLLYSQKRNVIDSTKMAILESRALELLIGEKSIRIDEQIDFNKLISEFKDLTAEIADGIIKQPELPEIYIYYFLISITEFSIWSVFSLPIEESIRKQYIGDFIGIIRKFIEISKNSKQTLLLFGIYTVYSCLNTMFGAFTEINQFEQKKYVKTAENWLKKGEALLNQQYAIPNTVLTLYYFMGFTNVILLLALGFSASFKHLMENLNAYSELLPIHYPKITITTAIVYATLILSLGAVNLSAPEISRIEFAKRSLSLIELTKTIPIANNPAYEIYNVVKLIFSCLSNAVLTDLIKDTTESSKHFQIAARIFDDLANYNFQKIDRTQIYTFHLNHTARTAIFLAKNSLNQSERINYFQKSIDFLIKTEIGGFYRFYIENLFFIGDIYFELAILANDDIELLKKSSSAYINAIDFCENRGYYNLEGSGYVNLAQIEDRLGNYHSAAENYKKAIEAFNNAILTLTYSKLGKRIEKLKEYLEAWQLIENAKSYHIEENHHNAQLNYEKASQILSNLREYKFEAPFYYGWSILQKAENLSKNNKHEEAAATYIVSKNEFQNAIEILNSYLEKKRSPEEIDRISKLIEIAKIRETYCSARHKIETARLEGKKGNHLIAAELYNKASSLFEKLHESFRIKREKDELLAIFYLCKAWENVEKAEVEQNYSIYAIASELFEKASKTFPESHMRKLSLGNSLYCKALESGGLFDQTTNLEEKTEYYKKIKIYLRESSKNYQLGGFELDAQYSLATSAFFDGMWHLIQSDYEVDHSKKNQYLNIATNYLNNALDIFDKAGYKERREEILKYLKMIKDEKAILSSALNLIEKPVISSVGISAPASPNEISSSVSIEEMQRTDLQSEAESNWYKRIQDIYIFMPKSGTCVYDHSFKSKEDIEPQLVSGGLAGISMLIQELTKSKTRVKIVEQEEMTILLEHGKYLSAALITEENLITLRNKLSELIQEIEDFYEEELETYAGDISIFPKIDKFVQKIFEN